MDGIVSESYYLQETELKLLLAGLGLKEWYGLFSEREKTDIIREPEEVRNRILAGMYQKGLVSWKQGSVLIRQPYARILSLMLQKKTCVTMQLTDAGHTVCCCYLADQSVVMVQKSQREKAMLRIAEISVTEWLGLVDDDIDRLEDGECFVLICCSSENGQIDKSVKIWKEKIRNRRIEWKNGSVYCSKEDFQDRLKELLW